MKLKSLLLGSLVLLIGSTDAQENTSAYTESWYTYWGVGAAQITYPDATDRFLNEFADLDGVDRTTIAMDMLGFYWPISSMTIGGVVVNGAGDRFDFQNEWFQYNHFTYSASMIHYLGSRFGSGLFLRGDIGSARLNYQDSNKANENSENGLGVLIGGGWSFNLGGTRILLNANYTVSKIEKEKTAIVGFSLGGLF